MVRNVKHLRGYALRATDGVIARVDALQRRLRETSPLVDTADSLLNISA